MLFRKLKLDWRYGVSELVIVVLGVLIALAAEDWRQDLSLRESERASLVRLASDMQVDIDDISGNLSRTLRGYEAARWLMQHRNGPAPDRDSLSARLTDFTACSILSSNTSEYSTLIASGQLTNLRDTEFRQSVVNHYERYPYVSDLYDFDCRAMEEAIVAIESEIEFDVDPTGEVWPIMATGDIPELLGNPTFQRAVGIVANTRNLRSPMEEQLINDLESLSDRALDLANR